MDFYEALNNNYLSKTNKHISLILSLHWMLFFFLDRLLSLQVLIWSQNHDDLFTDIIVIRVGKRLTASLESLLSLWQQPVDTGILSLRPRETSFILFLFAIEI